MVHDNKNIMIILSSPSGVGKTTLTKKIQQKYQSFKISVSHTTRLPRSNEVNGVDYHFISEKSFKELIDQKKFYEYAKIFENYYGTLKENVDKTILSNDIANVAASKEEVEKAKEKIEEYKGKLGLAKAISLVTSRPILYITIYRINLEEIREDQAFYDQYKEFKDFSKNLEVYAQDQQAL